MTRQWTIEELNRVHPLPDGWVWMYDHEVDDGMWHAKCEGRALFVAVDALGVEVFPGGHVPADVALAVILASKGLDSREAMAAEVEREASKHVPAGLHEIADRWAGYGREALARVVAMLRRGTVQP